MRIRKKPGTAEKLKKFKELLCLNPADYKGKWAMRFQNYNPIHVELGTGRGQFIIQLAEQNPMINYIGIEIIEEVLICALDKSSNKGLTNLQFVWCNVKELDQLFSTDELSCIYINFCDPWPKRRWEKRRLTHKSFLATYQDILRHESTIYFMTDNEMLFEFSLNELSDYGFHLKNICLDIYARQIPLQATTEYQDKFFLQNTRIYRCEAVSKKKVCKYTSSTIHIF